MKPPSWMKIETRKRCVDPVGHATSGPHMDATITVRLWHPGFWLFVLRHWLSATVPEPETPDER